MSKYPLVPLPNVLLLQRGFDLPSDDRRPGPFPVVASTSVVGRHNKAMSEGPGVVMGRSGSIGGAQWIDGAFWPLNTTLWVKDFRTHHQRWAYYLLKSLDLSGFNVGSGVPTLNRNHLTNLLVPVPPPDKQRAIAEVLGALDDKIEANDRQGTLLWSLVRSLYLSATRDAELVPLGELLDLAYGKGLPSSQRAGGPVPVLGSGGTAGWHDQALVKGPGVVVGRKGTIGSVYWVDVDFFPIDTTFYAVPRDGVPPIVAYLALDSVDFSDMNSDSAVPGLNRKAALARAVPSMSRGAMRLLSESTEPLVSLAHCRSLENAILRGLRDTLLPRLMSGALRVRDAECLVEDAESGVGRGA